MPSTYFKFPPIARAKKPEDNEKDELGLLGLLGDLTDHASGYRCAHIPDGEAPDLWYVAVLFQNHGSEWFELNCSVPFQERASPQLPGCPGVEFLEAQRTLLATAVCAWSTGVYPAAMAVGWKMTMIWPMNLWLRW
jgi:hypothetical protein